LEETLYGFRTNHRSTEIRRQKIRLANPANPADGLTVRVLDTRNAGTSFASRGIEPAR
jgi:hypothetical protein